MRSLLMSVRAPVLFALFLAAGLAARPAAADVLVRHGTVSPISAFELEPHLVLGAAGPPGPGAGSGAGIGVRGSFLVAPQGFLSAINDSVAIGVGLDLLHYDNADPRFGRCLRMTPGPAGTSICTEVSGTGGTNYAFIPVVMQWSFWLNQYWSVFGEPGLNVFVANGGSGATPAFYVGGRLRVSQAVTLTLRIGWPTFTFGGSFFL
jgi:hypothetical protein